MESVVSTLEELAANLKALELRAATTQAHLFALDDAGWDELMPTAKKPDHRNDPPEPRLASVPIRAPLTRFTVLRLINGGLA
jgi:hypothetical protein